MSKARPEREKGEISVFEAWPDVNPFATVKKRFYLLEFVLKEK